MSIQHEKQLKKVSLSYGYCVKNRGSKCKTKSHWQHTKLTNKTEIYNLEIYKKEKHNISENNKTEK